MVCYAARTFGQSKLVDNYVNNSKKCESAGSSRREGRSAAKDNFAQSYPAAGRAVGDTTDLLGKRNLERSMDAVTEYPDRHGTTWG